MRGFWLPVGLRAVAVFALGMVVWGGIHFVKRHTHFAPLPHASDAHTAEEHLIVDAAAAEAQVDAARAAESAARATLGAATQNARLTEKLSRLGAFASLAGMSPSTATPPDFMLDGRKAGSVVHFKGSRAVRDEPAQFLVVVRLLPGARGAPCDIVPVQPDDFDLDEGFRCAVKGEPGLAKVGAVRFQPAGGTHAILASQGTAAEMAKGEPFAINADLTGPMNFTIKGEDGELVQLNSDSQNTALVVNDENGKAVVRMRAGKDGFSITVDTTGR
ncbi:MAG TPA: hypothetical protein VFY20_11235 [Gemmatimonadales bacterium]|nr:hypothetical protein [Gemmatimonadales bacterium]